MAHPITIYNEFWQTPYNKENGRFDDYSEMSKDSKLAYIIASAERISASEHLRSLGLGQFGRPAAWVLDTCRRLARLLEVEAKRRYKSAERGCTRQHYNSPVS